MELKKATGRQGSWFARVEGKNLPCIHKYWLVGMEYHDPFRNFVGGEERVKEYADALASTERAILTNDEASLDANGDVLGFRRTGYIAVFRVADVSYSPEDGIRLKLVDRLVNLRP